MIVVKLKGGLGNQLFQYAVGRQLSEIHGTELKIDISMFGDYEWHDYSLWPLNIKENISSQEEIALLTHKKLSKFERVFGSFFGSKSKLASTHIVERHFHFDPEILKLPDGVYLDGYWQSEKYFKNIEEIIRREFTVNSQQTGKDRELSEDIGACESVSLHIRRGNYISDPLTNKTHGTCSLNYYQECVKLLTEEVKEPHFFVFSDDPEWAQDNLNLDWPKIFVDHNDADKDYEDLRSMSLCRHHIIANSTFSWWGAWLSTTKDKLVFFPKQWFAEGKHDTRDLFPAGWRSV